MKKKSSIRRKFLFGIIGFVIVMMVGVSLFICQRIYHTQMEQAASVSFSYSRMAADLIDGDKTMEYFETEVKDEYYDQIQDILNATQKESDLKYYYVFVPLEDDLVYIWDADNYPGSCELGQHENYMEGGKEAVEEICKHSIGDKVSFSLGGKTNPLHGEPVMINDAEIIAMSNGEYISSSPMFLGVPFTIGKCARVKTGNVEIVIGSMLHQSFDDHPLRVTGADPELYRYICLKSAHHFRAFFEDRAAEIVPTDPPGLACCNFAQYTYKNVPRPVYPLDDACFEI